MKNLLIACAAILMAACGSQTKPGALFTATETGVDPILLGMTEEEVPGTCDGLYDAVTSETIEDYEGSYTVLHFTLNGEPVMDANLFGAAIASIEVFTKNVASPEGISPGMAVKDLFRAGGKAWMRNDGELFVDLNQVDFKVSDLNESGRSKLADAYLHGDDPQIDESDFESHAKIKGIVIY